METKDILENNKLIAKFMGYKIILNQGEAKIDHFVLNGKQLSIWNLQYNSSWDWLMPVVEKIRSHCFTVVISDCGCCIDLWEDSLSTEMLNIKWNKELFVFGGKGFIRSNKEAVWLACVEFIKFYNNKRY